MMGWDRAASALGVDDVGWWAGIQKWCVGYMLQMDVKWQSDIVNLERKTLERAVEPLFVVIICNGKAVLWVKKAG